MMVINISFGFQQEVFFQTYGNMAFFSLNLSSLPLFPKPDPPADIPMFPWPVKDQGSKSYSQSNTQGEATEARADGLVDHHVLAPAIS